MSDVPRLQVVIAGSGPAGIEGALALRDLAGDRVETTILTPDADFVHLPTTVLTPFTRSHTERHPMAALADAAGAALRRGTVASVDPASRQLRAADGATLDYDALLLAVGGVPHLPYPRALAFGGPGTDERMHGLIQDMEGGYVTRIAFVVAPGVSWPLPLYELALMTADRAYDTYAHVELTIVTPESMALELFGTGPSQGIQELLDVAGITLETGARAEMPACNVVELHPRGERITVDRVVTLPVLAGPAIPGLPHDDAGFLCVDQHGQVTGAPGVYAAGDATNFPIKQGGLACQQADAAAESIAACAGAAIRPAPFAPMLRAILLTECATRWLERDLGTPDDGTITADGPPESPPWTKIAGRELSRHLDRISVHAHR